MKGNRSDSDTRGRPPKPTSIESSRKFTLDVGWILITNGVGIVLGFLVQPLLARWLGANGLGIYTLGMSVFELAILAATSACAINNIAGECNKAEGEHIDKLAGYPKGKQGAQICYNAYTCGS